MSKRQARGLVKSVCIFLLLFTQSGHAANAPETFKCSARGGAEWREYRSKHFLVATDIPKDAAAMLIKNLERIHTMVMHAMVGEEVDLPARTRVTAFGDSGQFKEVARGYGGYHTISPSKEARIVIPVLRLNADPEVVAHELVHHLSWYLFARQPRWFSEGLAQFIQTVASDRIDNETHLATGTHIVRGDTHQQGGVGVIPHDFNYEFQETPPVKVKELLSWAHLDGAALERRYYLQSWLLYHWLWNNRSKEFSEFQKRLSAAEDPDSAWRAALPEFDPLKPGALESLDNTLERYRRSARYAFYRVKVGGDPTFTESKLSPADVHLLVLDHRLGSAEREQREPLLRAELDEALREDPAQPLALARHAKLDHGSALPALRNSVTARPKDGQAWLYLARALSEAGNQTEAESAYRKAAALDDESAEAQNSLATHLVAKGLHKEALAFANRAVDLAPWDPSCIDTLAAVAQGLGKCTEALTLQRRAVSLTRMDATSLASLGDDDLYTKRLREYESRCAPSASK